MIDIHRLDRRTFLVDLGRGVMAVAILGAAAACGGSESSSPTTTTTSPGDDEPAGSSSSTTTAAVAALTVQRVDLGGIVSAYLLARGSEVAIVDTGVAGSADKLGDALTAIGRSYDDVLHVILTHQHPDHIGGLPEVLGRAAKATGHAGAADIPNIKSPRPLQTVGDGDEVFGLQVIATPGHTLGHLSVLDAAASVLVVGDALNNKDAKLSNSNPQYTADAEQAVQSAKKIAGLRFDTIFFGHGGPIEGGADEAVKRFAAAL